MKASLLVSILIPFSVFGHGGAAHTERIADCLYFEAEPEAYQACVDAVEEAHRKSHKQWNLSKRQNEPK